MEPHRRAWRLDHRAAAITGCNGALTGLAVLSAAEHTSMLISGATGVPASGGGVVRERSSEGMMVGRMVAGDGPHSTGAKSHGA